MVHWYLPKVPGGPAARGGSACATIGTKVIFFGGADRMAQAYDDIWVLETANGNYSWQQRATTCDEGLSVHARSGSTLTAIGDRLYLYGGQDMASGMCHGNILCLDTVSWNWSCIQVAGGLQPPPRHSHCTGKLADNCLLIFGGVGDNGQMNDVWIFNTDQRGWSCPDIKSAKPCAREMHTGTMVDSTTMVVYGGRSSSGRVLDDVAVLDAKEMQWRCLEPTPFARCAHSGCVMPREHVLGKNGQQQPMDTNEDDGSSPSSSGMVVLIYGGFSGESVEGDAFYIDPGSTEIEVVKRGPRPSDAAGVQQPDARFAHNAATVPSPDQKFSVDMVIFGGVNPNEDLKDVAVLRCCEDPAGSGIVAIGQGVTVEELSDNGTMGHKIDALTNTIQHKEGLVELQISEAAPE